MKKVLLVKPDGAIYSCTPVHKVAALNGIPVRQVPALLAAWHRMGAIEPRVGGGYFLVKYVKAKDSEALRLLAEAPKAPAPVALAKRQLAR